MNRWPYFSNLKTEAEDEDCDSKSRQQLEALQLQYVSLKVTTKPDTRTT